MRLDTSCGSQQIYHNKYIEDIYSFAVKIITFSWSIMKTSVFSRMQSTSENLNVFITLDENRYDIH